MIGAELRLPHYYYRRISYSVDLDDFLMLEESAERLVNPYGNADKEKETEAAGPGRETAPEAELKRVCVVSLSSNKKVSYQHFVNPYSLIAFRKGFISV